MTATVASATDPSTREPSTAPSGAARRRLTGLRWVVFPLALYAVSRLVGALFLAMGAGRQAALTTVPGYRAPFPTPASPSYLDVLANWDGQWYQLIATQGYPSALPTDGGAVAQNAWAFYPAYPSLVRAVMEVTGTGFALSAALVSTVAGAAAVLLLYRLIASAGTVFTARATVACLCAFAAAPAFQVAYTESLALVLVLLCLDALRRGRTWLLLLAALALSLTRPVAPVLGAVVCLHATVIMFQRRRGPEELRAWLFGVGRGVVIALMTLVWPVVAGLVTGVPRAYFSTMEAWPVYRNNPPIGGWFAWIWHVAGLPGLALLLLVSAVFVLVALQPGARAWGLELRLWAAAYPLYILAVTAPGPSVVRYLMLAAAPLWPLPRTAEQPDERRRVRWFVLAGLVSIGLLAQWYWCVHVFTIDVSPTAQMFP